MAKLLFIFLFFDFSYLVTIQGRSVEKYYITMTMSQVSVMSHDGVT